MKLYAVNPTQLDHYWPAVVSFIERALEYSHYDTPRTVYEALSQENAYLWIVCDDAIHAVVITRLEVTKTGKICNIWACAGDGMSNWLHLISGIENWARREGCYAVVENGRPAFARVLKKHGYKPTHVRLEKAL